MNCTVRRRDSGPDMNRWTPVGPSSTGRNDGARMNDEFREMGREGGGVALAPNGVSCPNVTLAARRRPSTDRRPSRATAVGIPEVVGYWAVRAVGNTTGRLAAHKHSSTGQRRPPMPASSVRLVRAGA